jgi:hypothetical protein
MSSYVVVEGRAGARLVERILAARGQSAIVADSGERSAAIMLASSVLAHERRPTVLVVDSNALEERGWADEHGTIDWLLRQAAVRTPYSLVMAVPQIQTLLFRDRTTLERALGERISDEDWFEARYLPRSVLHRLLGGEEVEQREMRLVNALDDAALRRMSEHPLIAEIERFLDNVSSRAEAEEPIRRAG